MTLAADILVSPPARAGLLACALVCCALQTWCGEGPVPGRPAQDPVAKALGLRGHRIEYPPSCVYKLRMLADGRMAAVVFPGSWPHPSGGPDREEGKGIVWAGYYDGNATAGENCWFMHLDCLGRPFYSPHKMNGVLVWRDGDKWYKHSFQTTVPEGSIGIGNFTEDSLGRTWFGMCSKAACVDRENKVRELPFLPANEDAAHRSGVGISQDEKGNMLIYPTYLQAISNHYGGRFEGPKPRAYLLPAGEIDKAVPVNLPWAENRFTYVPGGYWCATTFEARAEFWQLKDGKLVPANLWIDDAEAELMKLIEVLDSNVWEEREKATEKLIANHLGLKARVEALAKKEKRPEVKLRLDHVLEAWKEKPPTAPPPRFFGPLPGGERLLAARDVELVGATGRHLLVWGLWLPGEPKPEASLKTCHLVRVSDRGKLEPVIGDVREYCQPGLWLKFIKLPDGRILTMGGQKSRLWDGQKQEEIEFDHPVAAPFQRRWSWVTDGHGRYYGHNEPERLRVYDPRGVDAAEGYASETYDVCGRGRRDSRDQLWHLLSMEPRKKGDYSRPAKCRLVRFEEGKPKALGEIDLTDNEGKVRREAGPGLNLDWPVVLPFGPDSALVDCYFRAYLYADGKLEKFASLEDLLAKNRAAVVKGLAAEQKVCCRAAPAVSDQAGNLWFHTHSKPKEIKVVAADGKVLQADGWERCNCSGLLPAAGGVVVRNPRGGWGLLKVADGAVAAQDLVKFAPREYYSPDCSWARPDGSAVLCGRFEVDGQGKVARLFPPEEKGRVSREDLRGWRLAVHEVEYQAMGDTRGGVFLTNGDRKVQLPCFPVQLMDSPTSGELYAALSTGLYRIVLPGGSGRAVYEEVVPTAVYECGLYDSYELGGPHNSYEHFIDPQGRIWQVGILQCKVLTPPPDVRVRLVGRMR